MTPRRTPKLIVREMLIRWGEWEAQGLYAAKSQRSLLGRIGESRSTDGGRPLPPGIWIPADVQEIGRLLALMRDSCRAGQRYSRLIYKRYVGQEEVTGAAIGRAETWLVEAWLSLR